MARSFFAPAKHSWLVFAAEVKRLVAYRAQFWFELILSSCVEITVATSVWYAVFAASGKDIIGGYTLPMMVLYQVVAIFFGQATKGTGIGTFQREVYDGSLTKYLIYPLSVYSYKFGTFSPRAVFAVGQLMVALVLIKVFGTWPPEVSMNLGWMLAGLFSLFLACLLYFFIIVSLESFAFWFDSVWFLGFALQISVVFLSGKAIPLELFPTWLQALLHYSPFPFLAYFPAQVFLGRINVVDYLSGIVVLSLWILAAFTLSRSIMQRGLLQYTGVGQ